ncbi:MAG: hypothetical protein HY433_01095 [Candidatus Liptonbacteria bacterium]|nr:hypothetical protein [Candidatus Liptonbacteria bacterium]
MIFGWIQEGRATTVFATLPVREGIDEIIDIICTDGRKCQAKIEVLAREKADLPGKSLATIKLRLVKS